MKKELILITSYCSNSYKKETLLNLVKSLQPFRLDYDILVTSHVPLDLWFYDYFDLFYFNKENKVLTDQKYTQNAWFKPSNNYVIWSSYADYGNTMLAIWDMIIPSLSIAKTYGYEKIHYVEYDSHFTTDLELKDNSNLLDQYDYVIYNSNNSHDLIGAFFSFRLDRIIDEWKCIDHKSLMTLLDSSYPKAPEVLFYNMISNQRTFIRKEMETMNNNGVTINLMRGSKIYWEVPYYEPSTNKLKFVSWNVNGEVYDIKIIVDDTKLFFINSLGHNQWKTIDLHTKFEEVKKVTVFRNNKLVLDLDFETESFKSDFKYYNSVLTDESILLNKK